MITRRWVVLLLLLTACSARAADSDIGKTDIERLEHVLAGLDQFDVTFEQYVHGVEGELVEFATGRFIMQRPKFRWVVDDPYPQVIVSDGKLLKVYDPDLEQVTERELAQALEGTPLGILSRPDGRLRDEFQLLSHDQRGKAEYFMLAPLKPQTKAQRVEIWLEGKSLKRLDVLDEFGGRLRLEFKSATKSPPPAEPFVLKVPAGTEVLQG